LSAAFAVSSSTAATAATSSPTKRTLSSASAFSSGVHGMTPYFTGMSRPVITACTPGSASAREASIETIRACACGERSVLACSIPGSAMSSA
jgi:hypothetical protein